MSGRVRGQELLRGTYGVLLIARPAVAMRLLGVRDDQTARVVARVLGGRHVVQAGLSGLWPTRRTLALGVATDLTHAATALGLAVVDRRRARAGLVDAAVATTWALFGLRDLRRR